MSATMDENEDQQFDSVSLFEINGGDDEGADIHFEFNGKRIGVSIYASQSSEARDTAQVDTPVENRLIHLVNQLLAGASDDVDDIENEVFDIILDIGSTVFLKAAPRLEADDRSIQNLHSLLCPERLDFRLQTIDGNALVFLIRPEEANYVPHTAPESPFDSDSDSDFQVDGRLPHHSAKDIPVLEILLRGSRHIVGRAQVDGKDVLCKASSDGFSDPSFAQELASMQKVWQMYPRLGKSIRVPVLLGYVGHAETGAIVGLLREWIPAGPHGGRTLKEVDMSTVPKGTRQKWAVQIGETVSLLHEIGVVWGDGKPSNIVVDQDLDAWLIDFGGGWSEGWVDKELAGTEEGDKQAVARIEKFLDL